MTKSEMRKAVREKMAAMSHAEKEQKSTMLALSLVVHPRVRDARVVALFFPLRDEVQVGDVVEAVAAERTVVLPRVEGDVMRFYPFEPGKVAKGAYGITEPLGDVPIDPASIDVMVVPGVAYSADGCRMGRGKGYYDKYMSLPGFSAYKIGVCYAEQMLPSLPCEEHHIKVDEVISR